MTTLTLTALPIVVLFAAIAGTSAGRAWSARTACYLLIRIWPKDHARRVELQADYDSWIPTAERGRYARGLIGPEILSGITIRLNRTSATTRIIAAAAIISFAEIAHRPSASVLILTVSAMCTGLAVALHRNWRQWRWSQRLRYAGWAPFAAWVAATFGGTTFIGDAAASSGLYRSSAVTWIAFSVVLAIPISYFAAATADYLEQAIVARQLQVLGRPWRTPTFSPAAGAGGAFAGSCVTVGIAVQYLQDHWHTATPQTLQQIQTYQDTVMAQTLALLALLVTPFVIGAITWLSLWWISRRADRALQHRLRTTLTA